jgi:hypothetical protein
LALRTKPMGARFGSRSVRVTSAAVMWSSIVGFASRL